MPNSKVCGEQGIVHETSAPYTPQQHGVAERMHRTLKDKTSSLRHQAAASLPLWKEDMETAAYLYNVSPVLGKPVALSESFYKRKPDVSHARVWGCCAYVHVPS